MNTRSIQRALNGGVSGTHNGAEFSRGMYILCVCVCALVSMLCVISILLKAKGCVCIRIHAHISNGKLCYKVNIVVAMYFR